MYIRHEGHLFFQCTRARASSVFVSQLKVKLISELSFVIADLLEASVA